MNTYYEVLGVATKADPAVIRAAYRALAKKHHPDTRPGGESEFRRITEAYEILNDPERRTAYDKTLAGEHDALSTSAKVARDKSSAQPLTVVAESDGRNAYPRPGILSNALWLLLGVPAGYIVGIAAAHVLLRWVLVIFGDWMTLDDYSIGQAFETLVNIVRQFASEVTSGEAPDTPNSMLVVAVLGVWFFICSATAAGAVVSHSREARSNLPIWTVYIVLFATWLGLALRKVEGALASTDTMETITFLALQAALLAGIAASRTAVSQERFAVAPLYSETTS